MTRSVVRSLVAVTCDVSGDGGCGGGCLLEDVVTCEEIYLLVTTGVHICGHRRDVVVRGLPTTATVEVVVTCWR